LGRFNQAEQNGDWNGRVSGEKQPREDAAAQREPRRELPIIQSKRLEKTG
jgi:hypothetical protein